MVFGLDSVHSKGEKRLFLRHKLSNIGTLSGSDPAAHRGFKLKTDLGFMF